MATGHLFAISGSATGDLVEEPQMTAKLEQTPADVYAASHRHPVNRILHAVGIPVMACCGAAAVPGPRVVGATRGGPLAGVAAGSALLLLGHAIEGNRPVVFSKRGAALDGNRWWGRGVMRICRRTVARTRKQP